MGNHSISAYCILTTPDSQLQQATNVQRQKATLTAFWNKEGLIAAVMFLDLNSVQKLPGTSFWKRSMPDINRTCGATVVSPSPLLWDVQNHLLLGLLLFVICDILNISTALKQESQSHQSTAKIFWSSICCKGLKVFFDCIWPQKNHITSLLCTVRWVLEAKGKGRTPSYFRVLVYLSLYYTSIILYGYW